MSALVVTLARFGLLILLWLFIFFALVTVRNDVYGGRLISRKKKKALSNSRKSATSHTNSGYSSATAGSPPPDQLPNRNFM